MPRPSCVRLYCLLCRLSAHEHSRFSVGNEILFCTRTILEAYSIHRKNKLYLPTIRYRSHTLTCEEVFYLAWGRQNISNTTEILCNDFSLLKHIHSKYHFSKLVKDFDIHCPETHLIASKKDLITYRNSCANYVFKPEYSRFATETLIQPTSSEYTSINVCSNKPWVVQKYIKGIEYATHGFANHGNLIFNATYRPMYRIGKGSGTYFSPVVKPTIDGFVKDFCRSYQIHGQIGFDFLEDSSGKTYVIEANPRATSGIHLNTPLPQQILETSKFQTPDRQSQPLMIAHATALSLINPSSNRVRWQGFWKDFSSAEDVVFSWKDLKPSIAQYICLFEILWRAILRRQNPRAAATIDIEWNGDSIGP